jgi:hypothetical protein
VSDVDNPELERRGESTGGEDVWVRGSDLPVSLILHLLSFEPADALARGIITDRKLRELSTGAIHACLLYAAEQVRDGAIAPPVEAALSRRLQERGFAPDLQQARDIALGVLPSLAQGVGAGVSGSPLASPKHVVIALSYAAAVVRNGRFLKVPDESRQIRDRLNGLDRQLVEDLFVFQSELVLSARTPEMMVERWRRLVEKVEGEYRDDFGEFTNDLDGRDVLEDAHSLVSPGARSVFSQYLEDLDVRYEAATRQVSKSLSAAGIWRPSRWWWWRVPIHASSRFEWSIAKLLHEPLDPPSRDA